MKLAEQNIQQKKDKLFTSIFIAVYCSQPPLVQHASHNGPAEAEQFELETVLKYSCFPGTSNGMVECLFNHFSLGYLIVGFAHAKCFLYKTTASWFGPDLSCKREQ